MGNYLNIETDFIERTIKLIDQYNDLIKEHSFENQFNYTLMINCLLGLIVMPKERIVTFIPNDTINDTFRNKLGFEYSEISRGIPRFRDLIHQLRNSIAHFQIEIESVNNEFLVDYIVFRGPNGELVAKIKATEMLPFLKYYTQSLLQNLERRNG